MAITTLPRARMGRWRVSGFAFPDATTILMGVHKKMQKDEKKELTLGVKHL